MQHFRTFEEVRLNGAWVAVGVFDGIHRGHAALLSQMAAGARSQGLSSAVVTFFPHPVVILRGLERPIYLTSPEERAELIGQTGVETVITLPFTKELAALSAREFVGKLTESLGMRQLWAGRDFALGRNREGSIAALQTLGLELGYTVHVVDPVSAGEEKVSSSQVRNLLAAGEVSKAAELLGRWYSLSGPVIHGDARGRTIGFPTANVDFWPQKLLPANGVYVCWAIAGGVRYPAVINVGVRPTFENQPPTPQVEAHLIDAKIDLYGQELALHFVERLRAEQRFPSVDALVAQIRLDVDQAREVLTHAAQT